jgi:hypothetical protein
MKVHVGVSSSSLPHESARDLLRCAAAVGADCIDLRAGRGQRWEPELEFIADALPVAFVGVGDYLGSGVSETPLSPELMQTIIRRGIPLRVFAEPLTDTAVARRFGDDVARLRGTWGPDLRLAVEPHVAEPSLEQLDPLLTQHGVGAVVDTLGLVRVHARLDAARSFLLRHGIAVQVKGLAFKNGDYRHVALDASPPLVRWTAALLAGSQVPITVETKAGTSAQDISTIRRLIAEPEGAVPDDLPQEVSSCVLAA